MGTRGGYNISVTKHPQLLLFLNSDITYWWSRSVVIDGYRMIMSVALVSNEYQLLYHVKIRIKWNMVGCIGSKFIVQLVSKKGTN